MNNAQIVDIITTECKKKNIKSAFLLQECGINHSFLSDIKHKNRMPSVDKISVIADYLNVSVDYLLGRTDNPNGITGDNITIGDIQGNQNTTIGKGQPRPMDSTTTEFLRLFESLPISDRIEIMNLTLQKTKESTH